jgi:hypothetical protein
MLRSQSQPKEECPSLRLERRIVKQLANRIMSLIKIGAAITPAGSW